MYRAETGPELLNNRETSHRSAAQGFLKTPRCLPSFLVPEQRPKPQLCLWKGWGRSFLITLRVTHTPGLHPSAAGLLLLLTLPGAAPRPGGANAALRCSQGCGWKFEPLLGEELDLRRVTWRLPPELIPRLSASSGRSDEDSGFAGGADGEGGGWIRGATPRPPGGDRLPSRARQLRAQLQSSCPLACPARPGSA